MRADTLAKILLNERMRYDDEMNIKREKILAEKKNTVGSVHAVTFPTKQRMGAKMEVENRKSTSENIMGGRSG